MNHEQTIWMHPNQVYLVSGSAAANTLLFEDAYCHKLFFKYLHRFISPMANILHYKLHATEWALLISLKSEKEIKKAYLSQRNKSNRADREKDLHDLHRMISEHFRYFLSNFATCLL